MAKFSALLATLTLVASNAEERSSFLSDVYSGKVPKSKVEVVLAQHDEDIAWSNPLSSIRTVYCKGSRCDADAIRLPNVGREGHSFLHHIVNNYDSLADWTVFSQAEKPSDGYVDHKQGGGHLLSGSSFEDYLVHQDGDDALFLMTSKVHLPTLRHSVRSSFKTNPVQLPAQIHSKSAVYPKDGSDDVWGDYREVPHLRNFLEHKCGVEETAMADALRTFWDDFVQLPMPASEVVHYTQGARFAVSRERLHQRSKAYYQQLLDSVSVDVDPCLNYLFEFAWYYVMGTPTSAPCPMAGEDFKVSALEGRLLQEGGVSGINLDEVPLVVISGSMDMEMSDEALANFSAMEDEMKDNVAEGVAEALDVEKDWVEVEFDLGGAGRRLATVSVTYTINLPAEESADTTSVDALVNKLQSGSSTLTDALATSISAATGITVAVSGVVAEMVTVTQTTTSTKNDSSEGGSIRSAVAGVVALLAAACLA